MERYWFRKIFGIEVTRSNVLVTLTLDEASEPMADLELGIDSKSTEENVIKVSDNIWRIRGEIKDSYYKDAIENIARCGSTLLILDAHSSTTFRLLVVTDVTYSIKSAADGFHLWKENKKLSKIKALKYKLKLIGK